MRSTPRTLSCPLMSDLLHMPSNMCPLICPRALSYALYIHPSSTSPASHISHPSLVHLSCLSYHGVRPSFPLPASLALSPSLIVHDQACASCQNLARSRQSETNLCQIKSSDGGCSTHDTACSTRDSAASQHAIRLPLNTRYGMLNTTRHAQAVTSWHITSLINKTSRNTSCLITNSGYRC